VKLQQCPARFQISHSCCVNSASLRHIKRLKKVKAANSATTSAGRNAAQIAFRFHKDPGNDAR
jgi:hypothetical protein